MADMDIQPGTPKFVYSLPSNSSVLSMAILGDQLFVGREIIGVEVYKVDKTSFSPPSKLPISELGRRVYGLAACGVNNCLYVSDQDKNVLYKVDLSNPQQPKYKWLTTAVSPLGLSVNTNCNLLVVSLLVQEGMWNTDLLQGTSIRELTPFGSKVRDACLGHDIKISHAIQIPSGELLLSLRDALHAVVLVGMDGQITRKYGNTKGNQPGQLSDPRGIALFSKHGCVLVADSGNNRIMVLNPSLSDARQLPLSVVGGMIEPTTVLLDESRDRLYVGENGGQRRVLVFDNVTNIDAMFRQ